MLGQLVVSSMCQKCFTLWEIFVELVSIRLRTVISMRSHVAQRSVEPKHGTSVDRKINNI